MPAFTFGTAYAISPTQSPFEIAEHERQVACLASAILYEAGVEPIEGQQAIAEVVLNRLKSPAFPKTICDVVMQGSERKTGCQFSFTCDGSLRKILPVSMRQSALTVANEALDGKLPMQTFGATHYHANYVSPYWAPSLVRVAKIGHHIFYRTQYAGTTPYEPDFQIAARGDAPKPRTGFAPWGLAVQNLAIGRNR